MTDSDVFEHTTDLYLQLMEKMTARQHLSERESVAYHVLDFGVRLETGGIDGIANNTEPYLLALESVGLISHAKKLAKIIKKFPQLELGTWTENDGDKWEGRAAALHRLSDAHQDADESIFNRAAWTYWTSSSHLSE